MSEDFAVLDRIPLGVFVISGSYELLFWNPCMEGWTGIPSSEAVGRDLRELFPGFRDPRISGRIDALFDEGPPVVLSYQLHGDLFPRRRPTIIPRTRQCTASALPSVGGAIFAVEDRTDVAAKSREARAEIERRMAVETELRVAVEKVEMLMLELNHRVKNNLHMVQSLIMLGSSSMEDDPARERFAALEARVNSIAELHDILSRQRAGSSIAADEYLASICDHILLAFAGMPEGPALELDLEKVMLPSGQVLYLGLAVNELVTNSIKHGGKRISLSLAAIKDGVTEVAVHDDGPGFPTPIHSREGTFGIRLVETLVAQLGGTFEADGARGGFFRIRIPCSAEPPL
jgi:two-component sensor histidine kinase